MNTIQVIYRKHTSNRKHTLLCTRIIMQPLDPNVYGPTFAVCCTASPKLEIIHGTILTATLVHHEEPTKSN